MINVVEEEFRFPSHSGLCDIYAKKCVSTDPQKAEFPTAVVQLVHGMCENTDRYENFIQRMCDHGFVVYCHDHLGHGKSIASKDMEGYFGKKDGYKALVEDLKTITDRIKKDYPDLPVFLVGHSMGSFVSRLYTSKYSDMLTGAAYLGTAGSNPALGFGIKLAKCVRKINGDMYRSQLLIKMAFGAYNKRFEQRSEYDWLTRDQKVVDEYLKDEDCGFVFTAAGFSDLFMLLKAVNSPEWYESIPNDLPILLMAGGMDPVGNYGKGPTEVKAKLVESGCKDVELFIYPQDRHELHNELDKDSFFRDLFEWLDSKI